MAQIRSEKVRWMDSFSLEEEEEQADWTSTQTDRGRAVQRFPITDVAGLRPNPIGVPRHLLALADSHWVGDLRKVLNEIAELPVELAPTYQQYFDPDLIQRLEELVSGLEKLHKNVVPYREELLAMLKPDYTLEPLGQKFGRVATYEPVTADVAETIRTEIAAPLRAAADEFTWSGSTGSISDWLRDFSDGAEPKPCL